MLELLVTALVSAAFAGWFGYRFGYMRGKNWLPTGMRQVGAVEITGDTHRIRYYSKAPEPAPPSMPPEVEGGALVAELAHEYAPESYDLFQVRIRKGDVVKVIRSGSADLMKAFWRSHQPAGPGRVVELYDVKLGIVRGSR